MDFYKNLEILSEKTFEEIRKIFSKKSKKLIQRIQNIFSTFRFKN